MEVSASLIKELKEKTGAGLVDCKQTLVETGGNMEKAVEILRKKGMNKADKKAGRAANEGFIANKVEGNKGVVVKINCETDFVANTEDFKKFAKDAAELIFKKEYPFSAVLPEELENLRRNVIAKLGENILIPEWKFIHAKGTLYPYTHADAHHASKIGVIVDFEASKTDEEVMQIQKNIAMQITAMNPISVDIDTIPPEKLSELKAVFTEEAKATGKPEKILDNIVKGKLEKFYNESILLEQVYILDEEKKVKSVVNDFVKSKGVAFKIHSFVRASL